MTRDNQKKRHLNKPEDCIFCAEKEYIDNLFFKCIVAKQIWLGFLVSLMPTLEMTTCVLPNFG
jgi:hypothetical protein